MICVSLVKRVMTVPIGLTSKNETGLLITALVSLLWKFCDTSYDILENSYPLRTTKLIAAQELISKKIKDISVSSLF